MQEDIRLIISFITIICIYEQTKYAILYLPTILSRPGTEQISNWNINLPPLSSRPLHLNVYLNGKDVTYLGVGKGV